MKVLITILLGLGAHYSATANVPAEKGAWIGWPFDKASKPLFGFLQNSFGTTATQLLSVIAAAAFIAAIVCLWGKVVPHEWWPYLLMIGAISSILLFTIHLGPFAIIPLVIDVVIIYGYFSKLWDKVV